MLLNKHTLENIVDRKISVVFRVWKRPTVKKGGTLKTAKGVLFIENVEQIDRSEVTEADLKNAGLNSREELCEIDREGDFYRITVKFQGEDPRIALRENLDEQQLNEVLAKLEKLGDWTRQYLQIISEKPNIQAQILADCVGEEKLKFKTNVRKLKSLGLTESLNVGYKLSPRGLKILESLSKN